MKWYKVLCSVHVTYSRSRIFFEKLIIIYLVKKFLTFYGNRTFITMFLSASHWILLSCMNALCIISFKISFNNNKRNRIILLSFHFHLALQSTFLPSCFPTKILCDFFEQYELWSSSLCNFFHYFQPKCCPYCPVLRYPQLTVICGCEVVSWNKQN